jgi:hypothetical protein
MLLTLSVNNQHVNYFLRIDYLRVDRLSPYAGIIESSGAVRVYPFAVICPEGRDGFAKTVTNK